MKEVRDKIFDMLVADATYLSLLGSPASAPYNTHYLRPPKTPTLPQVVFMFHSGSVDGKSGRAILSSRIPCNFMVWTQDDTYETIATRIKFLLLHEAPQTVGFTAILTNDSEELYDDDLNARGKLLQFTLLYRRGL